jgi:hypothetical protein
MISLRTVERSPSQAYGAVLERQLGSGPREFESRSLRVGFDSPLRVLRPVSGSGREAFSGATADYGGFAPGGASGLESRRRREPWGSAPQSSAQYHAGEQLSRFEQLSDKEKDAGSNPASPTGTQ